MSAPNKVVDAAHYAQVQLQMLVTGTKQAYLVYWSCTATHTFRVPVNYDWLTAALTVLREANKAFLAEGKAPTEEFYAGDETKALRAMTKKAIKDVSTEYTVTKSALNDELCNQFMNE